jgi:hypothetical protein
MNIREGGVGAWTGSIWLRIRTGGELLCMRDVSSSLPNFTAPFDLSLQNWEVENVHRTLVKTGAEDNKFWECSRAVFVHVLGGTVNWILVVS